MGNVNALIYDLADVAATGELAKLREFDMMRQMIPLGSTQDKERFRELHQQALVAIGGFRRQAFLWRINNTPMGITATSVSLGDFHELWNGDAWVTIGCDENCTVVIQDPRIPPIAAVYMIGCFYLPAGQSFPLPPKQDPDVFTEMGAGFGDRAQPCIIGTYVVEFDEAGAC